MFMNKELQFESKLRGDFIICIPPEIRRSAGLRPNDTIIAKIDDSKFLARIYYQNQSFSFKIPSNTIKSLNLTADKPVIVAFSKFSKKLCSRKDIALQSYKLFFKKKHEVISKERFYRIRKQLEGVDFDPKKPLISIKAKFLGGRYKYITIPTNIAKKDDYLIFEYSNTIFLRKVWGTGKLSIPTKYLNYDKNTIKILNIISRQKRQQNKKNEIIKNYKNIIFLDLKSALPDTIEAENENVKLFVQEFPLNKLLIYYENKDSKGNPSKPLVIERFIPINIFTQFLGFYFGDGLKKGTRGLGAINSEMEVMRWFLKFIRTYIPFENVSCEVIHGEKKLSEKEKTNIKDYWQKLGIKVKRIKNNISNKNPKKYGALRIILNQIISRRVFVYFLDFLDDKIKNCPVLAKYYLKGIAMSDMGICHKHGKLSCISVGFQRNNRHLANHFLEILRSYGINDSIVKAPAAICIHNTKNYVKFLYDGIFDYHPERQKRFIRGFLNLAHVEYLLKKLRYLEKPLTAEEFRKKISINDDTYKPLSYLLKNNLIEVIPTYPKLYVISGVGESILNILENQ